MSKKLTKEIINKINTLIEIQIKNQKNINAIYEELLRIKKIKSDF